MAIFVCTYNCSVHILYMSTERITQLWELHCPQNNLADFRKYRRGCPLLCKFPRIKGKTVDVFFELMGNFLSGSSSPILWESCLVFGTGYCMWYSGNICVQQTDSTSSYYHRLLYWSKNKSNNSTHWITGTMQCLGLRNITLCNQHRRLWCWIN